MLSYEERSLHLFAETAISKNLRKEVGMGMKRKVTMRGTAIGIAIFGAIVISTLLVVWPPVSPVHSQKIYTFTAETVYPPSHYLNLTMVDWEKLCTEASGGRIRFQHYPAEQLFKAAEGLTATGKGSLDIFQSTPSYYAGQVAIGEIGSLPANFPKGYEDIYHLWWNTEMGQIIDKVYREKANVTVLSPWAVSGQCLIMRKGKAIRTLADIKGKKIRTTGGALTEIMKVLGASPVMMIAGEVYTGMQQGVVDGAMLPLYCLESYKLKEVAGSYTYPPLTDAGCVMLYMNLDRWNELPADLQKIMIDAAKEEGKKVAEYLVKDEKKMFELVKSLNIERIDLSSSEIQAYRKLTKTLWDTWIANCEKQKTGPQVRKVVEILQSRW